MSASPHIVVLAIDGLRASALGAYGGAWRPTPAFDHLASRSVVCEWAFSQSSRLADFYSSLLPQPTPWRHSRLVTDDAAISQLSGGKNFDELHVIEPVASPRPAERIADTAMADSFASFADVILQPQDDAKGSGARLSWIHVGGLVGPWDAPTELVLQLVDEDDPEPPATVEVPSAQVDRERESDAIFLAATRYAAQVAVLDACLEGWLELIDADENRPDALMLMGLRGFALGEHGVIGLEEAGPYSESRHVPVLIRLDRETLGQRWSDAPLGLHQLAGLLPELAGGNVAIASGLAAASSPSLKLQGERHQSLRTTDWQFVRHEPSPEEIEPQRDQLYVKPDDRWEFNDIASLEPGVVESFSESLAKPPHG